MSLLVGLEIDGEGAHPAAWRAAGHSPSALLTADHLGAAGRRAEAAGFGFVTLDDGPVDGAGPDVAGRFDPVGAAAFLSATTSAIGLVPVVPTVHAEPFHVSNQLSSLDHASLGRAGWLVGTRSTGTRTAALGLPADPDPAAEAADVIEAVRRLWDSWQDDAVIADEATGRFLDADRVHHVDYVGRSFAIRGPALVPRPPQGQVPVVAATGTPGTDVGIVPGPGAPAVENRTLAEIEVVLDDGGRPAARRLDGLDRHTPWPISGRERYVGDAAGLVDRLQTLAPHVDAVRLLPAVLEVDGRVLGEEVLPALGDLLLRPTTGTTLRDRLGLPRPVGRYVDTRRA
ncbi:LLM class flavin-dependent oxidoreductase [Actinomycetospora sp. OC33-EN08]|uniref:LLM class flavin-dependent oxidoreductase n=1 Tax=Actinomycetospora aurantiaca TaxID=3129233 RepID=A0ABU8MIM5_9PSEU